MNSYIGIRSIGLNALLLTILVSPVAWAQQPINTVELEAVMNIHHPNDSTSIYIGEGTGKGFEISKRSANSKENTMMGTYSGSGGYISSLGRSGHSRGNSYYGYASGKGGDFSIGKGLLSINNSFFGAFSGDLIGGGDNNSFFGHSSGRGITTGTDNVCVGVNSGMKLKGGDQNTIIGGYIQSQGSPGSNNTLIGYNAGQFLDTDIGGNESVNNIIIGSNAGPAKKSRLSNRLYIDIEKSDDPLIEGNFFADLVTVNHYNAINGTEHLTGFRINNSDRDLYWNLNTNNAGSLNLFSTGMITPSFQFKQGGSLAMSGILTASLVIASNINQPSDIRFKKEIGSLKSPLNVVQNLRGVSHLWNREDFPNKSFSDGLEYGFIAQEIEEVLPELVHTDSEGYKSVNYTKVIPILVEAIKEMEEEMSLNIKSLQSQNTALQLQLKKQQKQIVAILNQIK